MKSIEECLDMILKELVHNWDKPSDEMRDSLNAADLLIRFELSGYMQKHEFFKRLIDKLIKDGFAEPIYEKSMASIRNESEMFWYQSQILITIEGYYFITEQNGYSQQIQDKIQSEATRQQFDNRMETSTSDLATWTKDLRDWTKYAAIGAVGILILTLTDYLIRFYDWIISFCR